MSSKYLASLSEEGYGKLTEKLYKIQNKTCYICEWPIDLKLHSTNIDHIIPLANEGKDSEDNFALAHESCNKSKQDADLSTARILHRLKHIQDETQKTENKSASLKHVLFYFKGSRHDFKYKIENNTLEYSFPDIGDNNVYKSSIFFDKLSKEETSFAEVPIEYIFHDDFVNPRGINTTISQLVKEFKKSNPQLHLSLARVDNNKLKIFDGQHKAVAQILLGSKKLLLRIFLKPDLDRLIETNANAGRSLRQIAFDKSIMRQLNNALYEERVKKYQQDHGLRPDDFGFSEQQLVDYFKGENVNIKKYVIESIKHAITHSMDNKLKDYIDFEGKAKELPISHSAFDKTYLSLFIDSKLILKSPINFRSDEGLNPRELEISQMVKLLNIIAEEIYVKKFLPEVGVYRLENRIIEKKDAEVTDDHIAAYRISKEEVMYNWLLYLEKVIENYFLNTGKLLDNNRLFQENFDGQLWINIRNFIINLKQLPLWKDRGMASTVFAGKRTYDYWKEVFETGKSADGAQVLATPLNFVEMIIPVKND